MATFQETDVRCAVCGELQRVLTLESVGAYGPPDLDLRPAAPKRWALPHAVHRCYACGYCAGSLGQAGRLAGETVSSKVYQDVLAGSTLPRDARSYFCWALLEEAAGDHDSAGWRFLEAAWVCDDVPDLKRARVCRERAVEMFRRSLATGDARAPRGVVLTLVADLLRRARRFDEAVTTAAEAETELVDPSEDEGGSALEVVRFIAALAEAGDDGAHSCAEAFATES